MKILLAKRRALGDTVLLNSTVQNIAAKFPSAQISVLVPGAFAAVLKGNPAIKNIWSYEEGFFSLLQKIRAEKFDYYFHLHASTHIDFLALLSGAKKKAHHRQNKDTEQAYGKHPNALEWDGFFLQQYLGKDLPALAPTPKIYLSEEEKKWGQEFWRRWKVEGKNVFFLGLGASRATKRWLPKHFAALAELLKFRMDAIPVIVTGPGEAELLFSGSVIDEMRAHGFRPIPMGGGKGDFIHVPLLTVRELACALSAARAYVGNDSGPKHIAVAAGIPTFTFFGPEDPVEWHPYSREEHPLLFIEHLSCRKEDNGRWCSIPVCVQEQHRCMRNLDPLSAYEMIAKRLA